MKMEDLPLISVVVPVYGTEQYLKKCLDSLLEQTYRNLQVILVDDASPDNADLVIRKYLSRFRNVKYVRHSCNKGLFQARISGAEEADGDYIAFLDSDDYISSDFYRILVKKAIQTGADIVVSNTVFEDADGTQTIRQFYKLCFEKETLLGNEIRDTFFGQQGYCFSWHTVWNKIYARDLWNECLKYYKQMDRHLIMTEDIAFSVPLLYSARKLTFDYSASYYYCKHPKASTDAANISHKKFVKNMQDLKCAFDFAEEYLNSQDADEKIKKNFLEFRKKYARMWRTLQQERFSTDRAAQDLVDRFLPGYKRTQKEDEFCFDRVSARFSDGLDYAKKNILDSKVKYVSFDIFDTLILRPFWNPTDLFLLLNPLFEEVTQKAFQIPFDRIRILSEEYARRKLAERGNAQDVTLREIYEAMEKIFQIDETVVWKMYESEIQYEIRFCTVRKAGKELYEFAQDMGKKILIISDMYLEYETVEKILQGNGYNGYVHVLLSSKERRLKNTGALFKRALRLIRCCPENVLHIGDTWNTDIAAAQQLGIRTFFLPKTKEVFENLIQGIQTNNCGETEKYIAAPFYDSGSVRKSLGYRTMLAMVANRFFDNPFVSFQEQSDFNGNPYMIGYYPVGMHCLGITKWICDMAETEKYDRIYFLARDGFLPMKIYEICRTFFKGRMDPFYIQASRNLTLPYMLQKPADLYDIPIEFNTYTPLSICRLLSFCLKIEESEIEGVLEEADFVPDGAFRDEREVVKFIGFLLEKWFDVDKLCAQQGRLKKYYSQIENGAVTFDMGYSGRIQSAVSLAAGKPVDAFFIHKDSDKCGQKEKRQGFQVHAFYHGRPASTGIMREYLLSELCPPCLGIVDKEDGQQKLVFDKDCFSVPEKYVVHMIQKGAMDFARDFVDTFKELVPEITFVPQEVSYPFEYFLRYAKKEDLKIFSACNLEDKCYANIATVRADLFFNNQLCALERYEVPKEFSERKQVELNVKRTDLEEQEISEEPEEIFERAGDAEAGKTAAAMFMDVVTQEDSLEDKWLKTGGNTANLIQWEAIRQLMDPVLIDNWYMNHPGGFEEDEYDIFLTNHLGWIQENTDLSYLEDVLKRVGKAVLLPVEIGFTSDVWKKDFSLPDVSVRVLRRIAERCKAVGVRGEYSAEILSRMGVRNIELVGCTSLYANMAGIRNLTQKEEEAASVSASFKPFYGRFSEKEKQLLQYFAEKGCSLVETTPLKLAVSQLGDEELYRKLDVYTQDRKTYFDVAAWRKSFREIDFSMGMNFYHNVLSLQAGVPALFINYETSGRELCRFYHLPCIEIDQFDASKSVQEYYYMADYTDFYPLLQQKYKQFLEYLSENGVCISEPGEKIILK